LKIYTKGQFLIAIIFVTLFNNLVD
jgi:hypothetical protein